MEERLRQEETELKRSEAHKAAILDSSLDCIVAMDHEGCITEFNPAAERTFGYAGRTSWESIWPTSSSHRRSVKSTAPDSPVTWPQASHECSAAHRDDRAMCRRKRNPRRNSNHTHPAGGTSSFTAICATLPSASETKMPCLRPTRNSHGARSGGGRCLRTQQSALL